MNKLITTSLFAVATVLALAPAPAKAGGDETAAAVGGFIGGLIVGSTLDNDHHHARYHDHSGVHVSTRIVVGSRPRHHHHDHGYWEWNRVRVWVPGVWVIRYDDCGRRYRHFERGHHEFRRQRVWVSTGRHGRCDICG